MGRKKSLIVNLRPFCYYCDKEFNNELILHQHQKARHFQCNECFKKFSTAPALDTHYVCIHHKNILRIPNAKVGRDLFNISIYGMDGVPLELINYKLREKINLKRKKLIKENKLQYDIDNEKKEEKNTEIKNKIDNNKGFYHNPDSINLTLKQNQMNQMFPINNRDSRCSNIKSNKILSYDQDLD